jgi:hypothetical protein
MINKQTLGAAVFIAGVLLGAWITKSYYDKHTNVDQNTTKEHTVTKIIERPDGTKETIIVEDKKTKQISKTAVINDWSVGVATSLIEKNSVYTVFIDRRILGEFSLGAYVRSDKEAGVLVRYSF